MRIVYSYTARQDLRDIYEYIAFTLLAPEAARSMADRIMEAARSLADMPERRALYKDEPWYSRGIRFLPVKRYLLFFTVDAATETVSILRILYSGRDLSRQLEEETDV